MRRAHGIRRDELDQAAGLPPGTVRRIEQGRLSPAWPTLDRLCAHPSMRTLIEVCVREGVELGARPEAGPNGSGRGADGR
jgi:DNA-binding XRE family transcriptional regulator